MSEPRKYRLRSQNVETWLKKAKLPKDVMRIIRWLHDYGYSNDLSYEEIGTKLKQPNGNHYTGDSVYKLLSGRRTLEQMTNILGAIEAFAKLERERQDITQIDFIETTLSRKIWQACDAARNFRKMVSVIGATHTGKTENFKEYARRHNESTNVNNTIYVRTPSGGNKTRTLLGVAKQLNLPAYGSLPKIENAIIEAVDDTQLFLIDEAHQNTYGNVGMKTLGFWRELHDATRCGMVFGATDVFEEAIKHGEHAKRLNQIRQRHLLTLRLPDKATNSELNEFSGNFGLPPATGDALDLQSVIIRDDSLGRWLTILQGASKLANGQNAEINWEHVLDTYDALLDLEDLSEDEE